MSLMIMVVVIPPEVAPYIAMVTSLTAFPIIPRARPGKEATPQDIIEMKKSDIKFNSAVSIKQAYNLDLTTKATNPNTIQVCSSFLTASYDLNSFSKLFQSIPVK